jgi:gluconokinase
MTKEDALPMNRLVVMGVSGCGKSSVAAALARALGLPLIEGDDFHPPANVAKMAAGIALDDADRREWLAVLAIELAAHPGGAVLTCSALKRSYREVLRSANPGLRFVHLHIGRDDALQRVAARAGAHMFPPSLVDSQFAALESPAGENGVLEVQATDPIDSLTREITAWMRVCSPSALTPPPPEGVESPRERPIVDSGDAA